MSAPDSRSAANASPIMGYLDAIGAVKLFRNGHPDTGPRYKAGRSAHVATSLPRPVGLSNSSTRAYAFHVELATPGQIRTPKRSSRADRAQDLPPPLHECCRPDRKNGTSLPMRAAMQASAAWDSPRRSKGYQSPKDGAASKSPRPVPPRPVPASSGLPKARGDAVSRRNSSIGAG
jgi:hypothetical protein